MLSNVCAALRDKILEAHCAENHFVVRLEPWANEGLLKTPGVMWLHHLQHFLHRKI